MTRTDRAGAGSWDPLPMHPGVPTGLNFPTSWDRTCDGTACFCGDTEGPSDSPVFPQLLNCKAGVCILGPSDSRFTFFLHNSVSLGPRARLLKSPASAFGQQLSGALW